MITNYALHLQTDVKPAHGLTILAIAAVYAPKYGLDPLLLLFITFSTFLVFSTKLDQIYAGPMMK